MFFVFHLAVVLVAMYVFWIVDDNTNPSTASSVFDVYAFLVVAILLLRTKKLDWVALGAILFGLSFIVLQYMYYEQSNEIMHTNIFLKNVRFIVYLVLFIVAGRASMRPAGVEANIPGQFFLKFLLVSMALWYLYQILVLEYYRPRFYAENNFEIPGILILTAVYLSYSKLSRSWAFASIAVSFVSLSKSGIVEAAYFYLRTQFERLTAQRVLLLFVSCIVIFLGGYLLILERMGRRTIMEVDRVIFLMNLYDVMAASSVGRVLFGHGVATVLPYWVCLEQKYYGQRNILTYAYCDASIFHSVLLRLVYEIGLVGLALFLFVWYYSLVKFLGVWLGRTAFVIAFLASLSVTGFSNSITIWPVFCALLAFSFMKKS